MGSSPSAGRRGDSISQHGLPSSIRNFADIIRLMMPVYYTTELVSPEEHSAAMESWQLILSSRAPQYIALRANTKFATKFPSCIRFFASCFYDRLFDVHPMSRSLFSDVEGQGNFLVKMITLALSELTDSVRFEQTLVRLAENHNTKGIKAAEYGIVGEVLFWALKCCLGPDAFPPTIHFAWVKVYSRMLRIVIPVVVSYELQQADDMRKRKLQSAADFAAALGAAAEEVRGPE